MGDEIVPSSGSGEDSAQVTCGACQHWGVKCEARREDSANRRFKCKECHKHSRKCNSDPWPTTRAVGRPINREREPGSVHDGDEAGNSKESKKVEIEGDGEIDARGAEATKWPPISSNGGVKQGAADCSQDGNDDDTQAIGPAANPATPTAPGRGIAHGSPSAKPFERAGGFTPLNTATVQGFTPLNNASVKVKIIGIKFDVGEVKGMVNVQLGVNDKKSKNTGALSAATAKVAGKGAAKLTSDFTVYVDQETSERVVAVQAVYDPHGGIGASMTNADFSTIKKPFTLLVIVPNDSCEVLVTKNPTDTDTVFVREEFNTRTVNRNEDGSVFISQHEIHYHKTPQESSRSNSDGSLFVSFY